jgi:hypothetical protein
MVLMILLWRYVRLALSQEHNAEREFAATYERYAAVTPWWIRHWGHRDAAAYPGG